MAPAQAEDDDNPTFKKATLAEIFKHAQHPTTRVSEASLYLSAEYLRLFATEAIQRSAEIANLEKEDKEKLTKAKGKEMENKGGMNMPSLLETRHLEKVLAGLVLDF